ncbi:L,D-transpeptidase family protein [Salinimicrobium sp. HB62]|uniref:L,D-transpeptidase family protein n=1 Tax=Salinimicrobium sp. HB62 TaxID=3077781 RepID=UPI002D769DFF|nr:L,D-transpeptidase family protein [Salinimicrobium sp. HB62]
MKKNLLLPLILLLISLSACEEDKRDPMTRASSDEASKRIAEATPDGIRTEISAKNDIFEGGNLEEIYSQRDYRSLWRDGEVLHSFYNSLKAAEEEGLNFRDYHGLEIDSLLSLSNLDAGQAARLDLLLSDAFLTYARHLYYGKLDPEELHEFWGISRQPKDLKELLQKGVENNEIPEILEDLKPKSQVYHGLKKSLAEYRELKNKQDTINKIARGQVIKPNDSDPRISAIAQRLEQLSGFNPDSLTNQNVYSEALVEAIKEFQESKSIQTDGIIGNSTIDELNKGPQDIYNQILANLERWRWYPRDLGDHYILINIPHFRLAVVKDGDTIREHNVIAGAKARPTPIFSDTVNHLVINPTWTVPPTIKSKDIIPKMAADRSYLSRNNMTVTGPNGEKVDPSNVNWDSSEAMNYSFTQRAGPSNPLGQVKIMYPNKYLIYLHDTPAKSLFSQSERAESSGCVRVENAIDLSAYLVENQNEWSKDRIQEVIRSGKTTTVNVDRPIQVHHFYWTAWRAGDKTVVINDVYGLDEQIYTKLTE